MSESVVGQTIDGYRIKEVVGKGGMGIVYKAEDINLSRTVAIKRVGPTLADDESFLRRFRSEARALARIDSPYIVKIYTLRRTQIGLIIVMEYVEGTTLKQSIDPGGIKWREALPLIHQILTAIDHAHGAGVIHRDVKPQNILLTDIVLAHGTRVKMTDFGLAKVNTSGDPSRTVTRNVYGSLNYMSPEQVKGNGKVDDKSDIYSVGMTIYEMLAGRLPFEDGSTEYTIMRTIVEREIPPLSQFVSDVPEPIIQIVEKAIRKDPSRRFNDASEMQAAIEEFNNSAAYERVMLPTDDGDNAESVNSSRDSGTSSIHNDQVNGRVVKYVVSTVGLLLALMIVVYIFGYNPYSSQSEGGGPGGGASSQVVENGLDREEGAPRSSVPESSRIPDVIRSMMGIRDVDTFQNVLRKRIESGDVIAGPKPDYVSSANSQPFVFVIGRESNRVEAVLQTSMSPPVNVITDRPVAQWRQEFSNHLYYWIAPATD